MAVSSKIAEPSSFHKVAKPGPWPQILLSLGKADLIAKLDNKILGSESPLDVNSYRLKAFVILSHSNISETHSRFTEYANTLEDWLRTADYKILGQDSDNKPNAGIIGVAKCMEATVGETTLSTLENMWALHLEKNGELDVSFSFLSTHVIPNAVEYLAYTKKVSTQYIYSSHACYSCF